MLFRLFLISWRYNRRLVINFSINLFFFLRLFFNNRWPHMCFIRFTNLLLLLCLLFIDFSFCRSLLNILNACNILCLFFWFLSRLNLLFLHYWSWPGCHRSLILNLLFFIDILFNLFTLLFYHCFSASHLSHNRRFDLRFCGLNFLLFICCIL